jgi:hypothetical protein
MKIFFENCPQKNFIIEKSPKKIRRDKNRAIGRHIGRHKDLLGDIL